MSNSDSKFGVDQDQLAASDKAAVGCELDGFAAVAAQLDKIARLQVGQTTERQVDPPEFDGQSDRDVKRRGRAAVPPLAADGLLELMIGWIPRGSGSRGCCW